MKRYHAIVLVNRSAESLGFLAHERCPAMLPIGNKPLIQIALEELYDVGVRTCTISDDGEQRDLRRFVGDGSRWGLSVTWKDLSTANEAAFAALAGDTTLLAVRGDMLRPFGLLEEALRRSGEQQSADIYTALGVAVGIHDQGGLARISWTEVTATCRLVPCLVDTVAIYHTANIMALQGLVPGVRSAGRKAPDEIIVGKGSIVLSTQAPEKSVVIGTNCLIERGVRLGRNVVVGNNCLIDRDAELEDCVVLPGTYVGRGAVLTGKVVSGKRIHCPQRQITCAIDDPRLLDAA